ncbi:DNA mismatch repair endonuclease MutL [Desulfosporosinus fructosivorans]|uniref:DNA mismatch repair protein MutL n=1 Tax=Desulfosporosinus fructosivorans TaxID=2018669 RepID=A0A4Z0R5W8_9FIRM|nr:DNA mismatch repair endonuclease MutL [Desulfosporosinus fructosivorans]TGE37046.1 DNA mismatch repair endonuclease MutL [Desulfosporosinus fructosivorans]
MTPVIHILDSHSANQIAAGEVVERPASVVKELVENALDAGAKHIDITIEGNGVPLIRVRDDGCGIAIADLPLAVIRHATSKINKIDDLDHLQTLGFRGEALPSIASVSHMEISSRPADEVAGLCLKLIGGENGEFSEVGCPVGTSVTVRNLFFNTPARLKFLKSTPTEFGLISDTIGRIALAHPDIAFSLTHPQQVVLQTSGRGDLRETIGAVLGHGIARQLIPINVQKGDWQLEGFISPPDLVRSSKQTQNFMINGRIVRSPFLGRSLEEGYHTLIPTKLHPIVVLHLHVPPSEYDVNVHPTKMDVRFRSEQALAPFISQSVYQTLIKSKPLPSYQTLRSSLEPATTFSTKPSPSSVLATNSENAKARGQFKETVAPLASSSPLKLPLRPEIVDQPKFFLPAQEQTGILESLVAKGPIQKASPELDVQVAQPLTHTTPPSEVSKISELEEVGVSRLDTLAQLETIADDVLAHIWPLAQLFSTYILATDGDVLLMIDQHAAHERINYERLFAEFRQAERSSQTLLIPLPMEFTLQEEQVVLENLWSLTEMGFILEQFGERTYLLRGVPVQTGNVQADSLLRQFIEEVLQKNSTPTIEKLLEEWIYLLACKESIKGQDSLSLLEMEQLIALLGRSQNPYTCPHGRPTMVRMTRAELEKRFYRT